MDAIADDFHPLRIGETVPVFTARSTQGPFDLGALRGRWVVLFAHPADFTPVCTTEFVALAKAAPEFAKLDSALVAVSVDSLYSHLAWLRTIYDMTGVKVGFPIVEDPTMEIARAYGMIGTDAHDAGAVRATYYIDPDGVLRATSCYPANVGRSIPEMLRVLAALQAVDGDTCLAPADWHSGDALLRAPAETAEEVYGSKDPCDWFFSHLEGKR